MWFGLAWSGVCGLGSLDRSDVDDEVQQRTAGLGGKPVLDTSFTGSSQLSYKLINEAMAAPGGGSVLVSIGISALNRDRPWTGVPTTWSGLSWPDLV